MHFWHPYVCIDTLDPTRLTTAPLDPTIDRCQVCGIPVAVRTYADSTLVVPPDHSPPAETKAARQRRINRERLRQTAAARRREQRALSRSGRVA